jgi:hypothetical protein
MVNYPSSDLFLGDLKAIGQNQAPKGDPLTFERNEIEGLALCHCVADPLECLLYGVHI